MIVISVLCTSKKPNHVVKVFAVCSKPATRINEADSCSAQNTDLHSGNIFLSSLRLMMPLSIAGSDNYQDVGITTLFCSILIAVIISGYT